MDSLANMPPRGFVRVSSAVPGITVFAPAPKKEKIDDVVAFSCPQCGGETAYSVENGGLTCAYCGYHEAPQGKSLGRQAESFEFTVDTVERAASGWGAFALGGAAGRTVGGCFGCVRPTTCSAGAGGRFKITGAGLGAGECFGTAGVTVGGIAIGGIALGLGRAF